MNIGIRRLKGNITEDINMVLDFIAVLGKRLEKIRNYCTHIDNILVQKAETLNQIYVSNISNLIDYLRRT